MIEIEFSAIARLALKQRIPTQQQLEQQVLALVQERAAKQLKINWQFSITTARSKFNSAYRELHPANEKYQIT